MATLEQTPATKADLASLKDEMRQHYATKEYILRLILGSLVVNIAATTALTRLLS